MKTSIADKILKSRAALLDNLPALSRVDEAAEGGCGVLGFAANIPVAGRHVLTASRQMHNRGNGKGGGIAMVGLDAAQARVDWDTLNSHYLLQIALLDPDAQQEIEANFIRPNFDIAQTYTLDHIEDYRQIDGLSVQPPEVVRYFVRVKHEVLADFADQNGLDALSDRAIEDEFVYQTSFRLNRQFYASLGDKRAFVLSHGRNLSVLKIVGYAEDVVAYYRLEDQVAHVWIAHQRYPTKGRVWHPGGAHPFIGLNEALVHNGDFANYHAVSEYLKQRNIGQLFLTDTEVSVQLFDLWARVYNYPLEIILEAMAPTTEFDFNMLPDEKQSLYQAVQRTHIHGSPDGPWFFIVARSLATESGEGEPGHRFELLGITDTSMLRPQVFALYENHDVTNPVEIGLVASERQAINACLRSLAAEDDRFQTTADRYWVARGGSHTDGGAFRFSVSTWESELQSAKLECANKFGDSVRISGNQHHRMPGQIDTGRVSDGYRSEWSNRAYHAYDDGGVKTFWDWVRPNVKDMTWDELGWSLDWMAEFAQNGDSEWRFSLGTLNLLHDIRYSTGEKKRASVLRLIDLALMKIFGMLPSLGGEINSRITFAHHVDYETRHAIDNIDAPISNNDTERALLVINTEDFPPEGDDAAARWIVRAVEKGWKSILAYNWRGGRFAGCGLGPQSQGVRVELYGDVGDYTASGLDGAEVIIHGDGQDQLGQILKSGKLVVHGDVGQTFLYGAKGGDIYVLGSAAGRPLINAVGKPRAVINGACLDYLAESFMAGDSLNGGGFVILNGIQFDENGNLTEMETPYPGGNLFSLASGGAIYLRDPRQVVYADQLNGGVFTRLGDADWKLIEPYLQENERLFGIKVEDLLRVDGKLLPPYEVYRKVEVRSETVLSDSDNH